MGNSRAEPVASGDADHFHWIGGHPVADFVNTLTDRGNPKEEELLASYADLLRWMVRAELVAEAEADRLQRLASANPTGAHRALEEARELREAIHAIIQSHARMSKPPAPTTAWLDALFTESGTSWKLEWSDHGARRRMAPAIALRTPILLMVDAFVALATSPEFAKAKICRGEGCDFAFIDWSPKQDRLWCEMRICGNRAKVTAWRARRRKARS